MAPDVTEPNARVPLRRLTVDDLDALDALEKRAQPVPWNDDQLLLELVNDDALVLGVDADPEVEHGALVAHIVLRTMVDELWVLNVAVDPAHRRKHIATALLDAAIEHGRMSACASLWLEVRESNAAARALYARFELDEKGRRKGYYPPIPPSTERETAVLMSRPL